MPPTPPSPDDSTVHRLLVFRRGALGDTVVALPYFHLLRRVFPEAEIRVLTVAPRLASEAPLAAVLGDSGLVDGVFTYPAGCRDPRVLWRLYRRLRAWSPRVAVYLAEPRSRRRVRMELAALRLSGVRRVFGAPLSADLHGHRRRANGLMESECERLGRCLSPLGDARLGERASWDLRLSPEEWAAAERLLRAWPGSRSYIAFSVGAKQAERDWGDERWGAALDAVKRVLPGRGLLIVGARSEAERSRRLAAHWGEGGGAVLNLCGRCSPRESAAALARAELFVGHDSGPMHLAAAMGVPVVCVFARNNPPGVWYPYGEGHTPLYPREGEAGVGDIPPQRLVEAVSRLVSGSRPDDGASLVV